MPLQTSPVSADGYEKSAGDTDAKFRFASHGRSLFS